MEQGRAASGWGVQFLAMELSRKMAGQLTYETARTWMTHARAGAGCTAGAMQCDSKDMFEQRVGDSAPHAGVICTSPVFSI